MTRYYLVSAGYSNSYVATSEQDADSVRQSILDDLRKRFPMDHVKRISDFNIKEIDASEAANYQPLDETAKKEMLARLMVEVDVTEEDKEMNNNAPFDKL